jgi:excisionase family DNA binding protein
MQSYDRNLSPPSLTVTTQQAAKVTNLSVSTIRKLIRTGALPSIKIGKCRRISMRALQSLCSEPEPAPLDAKSRAAGERDGDE